MPTQKQMEAVEELFKKSSKPKNMIEDIDIISKIALIYDSTPQGENALKLATAMAKKQHLPLKVFTTEDCFLTMKAATDEIRSKEEEMEKFLHEYSEEKEIKSRVEVLVGGKIKKVLNMMEEEMDAEDKLSTKILKKLISENFSLIIAGTPLMRTNLDQGSLGYYLSILLKEPDMHANFLLVPDQLTERTDTLLGLMNYRQAEGTATALVRRALSIRQNYSDIKIIGLIEDNTIETIARSEMEDDNQEFEPKFMEVSNRLKTKFKNSLDSIEIKEDYEIEVSNDVGIGIFSSQLKMALDQYKPAIVLVRSVTQLDEHLNPDAETITRIALSEGYPVFVLWD